MVRDEMERNRMARKIKDIYKQDPPMIKGGQGRGPDDYAETTLILAIMYGALFLVIAICAVID
jgi:hypothetical protein